ncbi:extracellular solute-binding protein [Labrys wisconsinensis]|uniref:Microcin C transport system substrate-binding protein n=1 Tax=Labrys wisconsinensis TaxID=425677 RepID=A0ABU0J1P3_9HYPH|nr:extracellular solute-binding protein [Labrys wisconsinensis]MDQ0468168.1 microcin C transport system substrate-binding protein [Labrys wisconsinensis]
MSGPTRRDVLAFGVAGAAAALLPAGVRGQEVESHGLSTFGDLKYPRDFQALDYVNPHAPKGGTFSRQIEQLIGNQNFNSFDTLHIFCLRGDGAAGMDLCFASLMARANDEADALYGLAAESVIVSADRLIYRFRLRKNLTFHDGSPLTAEDCAWSFNTIKAKGHPYFAQPLHSFVVAVAEAPDMVRVTLAPGRGRSLPLLVATLPIFSKAWWAGRDFEQPSLDVPLSSGPYKVGRFQTGQSIDLERVKSWWGEALPIEVGTNNFDRLRWDYYRDRAVAFEAFKARNFLFREEFTSWIWANGYDFPAAKDNRVRRETLPDQTPSAAQGWFFNTRRPKFADPRVRQALGMAFDFEWTNKTIMFSSYARTVSFFQNSDMMASGKPSAEELALLEPYRDRLSPLVFGDAVLPPVSDGSGEDRTLLREAAGLLKQAGWSIDGGKLRNAKGEAFTIEFLDDDNSLERHTAPLIKNLSRLGIDANYRLVDTAQFQARADVFDFDMLVRRYSFGLTPGDDVVFTWSSRAAATNGSYNMAGIADPVVDALLQKIIAADSRDALDTVCRALDRVLRAGFYWIPQWSKPEHWLAYWDVFIHPETKPRYARGAPDIWWSKE